MRKHGSPPPTSLLDGASLFLDFDGTLVEIMARPDAVTVEKRLHDLLQRLQHRLNRRVAIVSGRPAAQIMAHFGDLELAVAGSHGAELHFWGGTSQYLVNPWDKTAAVAEAQKLCARHPNILVEEKPFGLALHYRQAPDAAIGCHNLISQLAGEQGLTMQTGKQVVELIASGADKGAAVYALMTRAPMRGNRPVFVGDDDTDEAGFRMAQSLGGAGVRVGAASATAAKFALPGVDETLTWLEDAAAL
jgi:trehalose 6-phosphate phosphatase